MNDTYGVIVTAPEPGKLALAFMRGVTIEQSAGEVYYFADILDEGRPLRCIAYVHNSPTETVLRMKKGTTALDLAWAAGGLWKRLPAHQLTDCKVPHHAPGCLCYFVATPVDADGGLEMEAFESVTHDLPARVESPAQISGEVSR